MPQFELSAGFPRPSDAEWRRLVDKAIKGSDFERRLVAVTADGLRVQPLYTRADAIAGRDAAVPGEAPFVRGTRQPAGGGWDIRQCAPEADAVAANTGILEDLAGGSTSVLLHVAAPGLGGIGYEQVVMGRALAGVMLDVCPVSLVAGELTPDAAGSLMALWRAAGVSGAQCRGAFNYDPLGTLAATGSLYHALPRAMEIAAGLLTTTLPMPGVTALRADGHLWHRAGATEAQELALVVASLVAYLRAAEAAGIAPLDALPHISITIAADADQFLVVAKLRAIRRLVGRVAQSCGAAPAMPRLVVTAETSARMMTKRDPWVNLLRTTIAAAGAAMGGADALTVLPFTWALGLPSAFARRIARNTHHVLIEEAGLGRVADPAGGSWYVERLTDDLAVAAWGQFQAIESQGGLGVAIETGYAAAELAKSSQARAERVATGRQPLTGTSAFPRLEPDAVTAEPWPSLAPADSLGGARVTPLSLQRDAEPFERLREAADTCATRTGAQPAVFLASLGPLAAHATRTNWMRNFLGAGGLAGLGGEGWSATSELGAAFAASGATVACLCGPDELYGELGEAAASMLKAAGAKRVYLAGRPGAQEACLRTAGVDQFLYAGVDMTATLAAIQADLGVA